MNPINLVAQATTSGSLNAGVWTLIGIIVVAFGGVLVAYIKQRAPQKIAQSAVEKADSESRAADFARLRDEINHQNTRIEKLEGLVDRAGKAAEEATRHAMRSDAKLEAALAACEVLLSLVEREMPNAAEISLAKRLLALAAADDGGIGAAMRKLSAIRENGE